MPRKRRSYPAELKAQVALEALREEATMGGAGGPLRCASEPDCPLEEDGSTDGAGRLLGEPRAAEGLSGDRGQGAAGKDRSTRHRAGFFIRRPSVGEPRPESRDGTIPTTPAQHRTGSAAGCRSPARRSTTRARGETPLTLRLMRLRRAVLGDAVFRFAADDTLAPPSGRHGLSQAGAPPDATAGGARALPTAQDVSAAPGAPDLSLPAAQPADHAPEPVWCTDVTYIPLQRGLSIPGRRDGPGEPHVLSWRLSNTLDASFCVEALHEALERYGPPGDLQQRPGQPIHQRPTSPDVLTEAGILHLDGRHGPLDGQRVHRAAVALTQSTNASTCPSLPPAPGPGVGSAGGWTSTTSADRTRRSTTGRRRGRTLTERCSEPGAAPRLPSAQGSLNHDPGFHLSCDENLSKGWVHLFT